MHKRPLPAGLQFLLTLLLVFLLFTASAISAQTPSPTPSVTPSVTATFVPTQPTATVTQTPLPDPDLANRMANRTVITAANVARIEPLYTWQAHSSIYSAEIPDIARISSLIFNPATGQLISSAANGDNTGIGIRLWDITEGNVNAIGNVFELDPGRSPFILNSLQISPDGELISGAVGPEEYIWTTGGVLVGNIGQLSSTTAAVLDNSSVLIGGENGTIGIWAFYADMNGLRQEDGYFIPTSGQLMSALSVNEPVVQVSSDIYQYGRHYFVLTRSGKFYKYLFDGIQSEVLLVEQENPGVMSEWLVPGRVLMAFRKVRPVVTFAGRYRDLVSYNYIDNEVIARYPLTQPARCLAYSADGDLLMVSEDDPNGRLYLLDAFNQQISIELEVDTLVTSCAFSADGTWMATGDQNGEITLWGVAGSD